MRFVDIHECYQKLFDQNVTLYGWVATVREQKNLLFVKVADGSEPKGIQVLLEGVVSQKPTTGCCIRVEGIVVASPSPEQPFEIKADIIEILGTVEKDYPLSKSRMSLEHLREHCHLRFRTSTFGSIFRIRSAVMHATHDFFRNERYLHLDPNIITVNECEGGAGVFTVSEHNLTKLSKYDPTTDHFCQLAYLTVSSQLQLEAISCALGPVYTVNKSFRSEHSNTVKHLSEFSHLEIENTFIDLDYLMNISEKYIRFIIDYVLTHHKGDIDNLSNFVSKGLTDRLVKFQQTKFQRVTYSDAIDIVGGKWGEDLSSEMEQRLTAHFGCPVFVSHWPFEIKSFYMKRDTNNPLLCHNFDLIMPGKVGELIGGSMREENLDQLKDAMKTKGVSEIPLQFYLDLRKFGTAPHGGFGLGLERLIMFVTGMENIKDVVPFPVYYKNCKY